MAINLNSFSKTAHCTSSAQQRGQILGVGTRVFVCLCRVCVCAAETPQSRQKWKKTIGLLKRQGGGCDIFWKLVQ